MMNRPDLSKMMGMQQPNPQELVKKAYKGGLTVGLCVGFGIGVTVIEVIIHLFPH